ncbi:MAG: hypothetical protein Q8N17_18330 [Burkholderiaceae bacterium]|nr:hypothetical protein [Burkholderiaceae bacterium]
MCGLALVARLNRIQVEGAQALSKLIKSDQETYGKLIADLRLVEQ